MRARKVLHSLAIVNNHIPQEMAPTCWYFLATPPANAIVPDAEKWTCMFAYLQQIKEGSILCFSKDNTGCSGASCYMGYSQPSSKGGYFLAKEAKFKKSVELGEAFYEQLNITPNVHEYLVWQKLDNIEDGVEIEVVNLWVNGESLAKLAILANYDRKSNDNVSIPFASGCQSLWTLPFAEKGAPQARCILGAIDPVVRKHVTMDNLAFSMPAERFVEMAGNIKGSFLDQGL